MKIFKKESIPVISWTTSKSHADEATYNKIRRHLTDINDVISEEDIRNIIIFPLSDIRKDGPKMQLNKSL